MSGSQAKAESSLPRVVIVGGGFAGMAVAKGLARVRATVVMIDRTNHHVFQPLLYQVATGELDASNIAEPLRRGLRRQRNARVSLNEVVGVDLERQVVRGKSGEETYDYLVLATGVRTSYFGNEGIEAHAPGLKTVDDALEIRRRVLLAFEEAEWEADEEARRAHLTFVVVGGGPTGVELSGAIAEVARNTLPKEYRNIDTRTARVILVGSRDQLVPTMPEALQLRVHRELEAMGVEFRLGCRVTKVDEAGVSIGDEIVPAENVFWAAGVRGQAMVDLLDVERDRSGRIVVGADLSVPGHPRVFVAGDAASAPNAGTGERVPGVAQGAIQTGRHVAAIIRDDLEGRRDGSRGAFQYFDKGSMAMIGRGKAVVAIGRVHFGGFLGWMAWSMVHVMFLVGFGNKMIVMGRWLLNLIASRRAVCLITGDPDVHIKRLRDTGEGGEGDGSKG